MNFADSSNLEERFGLLAASAFLGFFCGDPSGGIVDSNGAFLQMLGYEPQEPRPARWSALTPPEYAALDADALEQARAFGVCTPYEKELIRKDGACLPVLTGIIHFDPESGAFISFVLDLSERRRFQESLHQSEDLYRSLFETMPLGVVYQDAAGRMTSVNPTARAMLGLTPQEIADPGSLHLWGRIVREDGLPYSEDALPPMRALRTGQQIHQAVIGVSHPEQSELRWLLVDSVPQFRSGQDRPYQVYSTFVDITEKRRAEDELRRAASRQRAFLRDVLASVTEGHLILCGSAYELPPPMLPFGEPVTLTLPDGLRDMRHAALEAAKSVGMSDDRRHDLVTAVSEAAMNVVVHVGTGMGQVFTGADGVVQVRIVDEGAGIALENLPKATLARGFSTKATLGHGMKIMLQMADRVYLLTGRTGTTVVIEQDRIVAPSLW